MAGSPRWTDQQVDQVVGTLLRAGVLIAAAVVALGAVLFLWQNAAQPPHHEQFQGEPPQLRRVSDIAASALALDGKSVIQFGLLLLIATPVARVVLLLAAFALQRDRLYVVVTLIVLAVLVVSMAGGRF
jgi:uncharacterized membrane protein